MEQKRKRGRPRKIVKITSQKEKEKEEVNDEKKEENIVLFLALSESENNSDENNGFTVNDTEQQQHTNKIKSVTETDESASESSGEVFDKKQITIKTLIAEIKKRDKIIASLKKNKYINSTYSGNVPVNIEYHSMLLSNMEGNIFKPKKTDKLCWWCNDSFDSLPVYIPNFYKNNTFYVFGNCCSFECASAYNITHLNDYKCLTRHSLLNNMKYKITGDSTPIKFAPSPELLIDKGGTQSRDLYKQNLTHISENFRINMPPIIPLVHIC